MQHAQRTTPRLIAALALITISAFVILALHVKSASAAATVSLPPTASYDGQSISSDQAAGQGLACLQGASGKLTCFDSLAELRGSAEARKESAAADPISATARSARHQARAASTNSYMLVTENSYFNDYAAGWAIAGYARQNWYNMTGAYDNSATSLDGGNHSGYLARYSGGGGDRQRVDQYQEYYSLSGVGFNDLASSRYRN